MMKNRSAIIRQFDSGSIVAALILLLMACFGPLYFASVLPREKIALELGAFMALAAVIAGRRTVEELRLAAAPALAVAVVGFFGILQSLPWPRGLASILAPKITGIWSQAAALTGTPADFVPLSLSPAVSRATGVQWLAVAACLAAACIVGRERRLRRPLGAGILTVAIFEIVYGSDNWFAQTGTIWGMEVGGDPTRVRGTFVNPDHLAMFLIIVTAGGFALLWWSLRRVRRQGAVEHRLLQAVLPSLLFLMLFVGLAFTGSRAGLAGLMLALASQALMLAVRYRRWQSGLLSGGALVLGLTGIALFGLQRGLGRWMETSAYEVTWSSRLTVYGASWDLWLFSPLTGTGLGTFRQAFPQVQPPDLSLAWLHAHSDPLELLVTTGIVCLPLAVWGLATLFRRLWEVFQHGSRSEDRAAGLAATGALIGVLAHSTVDFGLTIPANAFTLAIVCGLACGARTRRPPAAPDGTAADDAKADDAEADDQPESRTRPG